MAADTKKEGPLVLNNMQKTGFSKNSVSKDLVPNENSISLQISIKIFVHPRKGVLTDHFSTVFMTV